MFRRLALLTISFSSLTTFAQDSIHINNAPKLFAADVISTGEFELNASFTPDESTVYFTKGTTNWDILALFSSSFKKNKWQEPILLPFSGTYRDADPFVSFDGKKLYFISDRPINGGEYKNFDYHVFYVELIGNKIVSDLKLVDLPLPAGMNALYPSIAVNGNMYFTATKNGNNDIYVCEWKNNQYQEPRLLPFNNSTFHDLDPVVAFDESYIIFTSNNRKGFGGNDLYISFQKNGTWTEPMNLGPQINGRGSDMAPGLSRDNKKLYFTSYKEKFDRTTLSKEGMTSSQLLSKLRSYQNGLGNIYEVDISSLVRPLK